MVHGDFEAVLINRVGGVRQNMTRGKTPKMAAKFKIANFLLGVAYGSKRLFCAARHDLHVYRFSCRSVKIDEEGAVYKEIAL